MMGFSPCDSSLLSKSRRQGLNGLRENRISRTKQNPTGAPCSHQRTWADYEFFECLHSTINNNGWALPVFFGPRALARPEFPLSCRAYRQETLPHRLSTVRFAKDSLAVTEAVAPLPCNLRHPT
jgi:hypothetical protein